MIYIRRRRLFRVARQKRQSVSLRSHKPHTIASAVVIVMILSGLIGGLAVWRGNSDYTHAAPSVASISPNSGTTAGGTSVTITGSQLVGDGGVADCEYRGGSGWQNDCYGSVNGSTFSIEDYMGYLQLSDSVNLGLSSPVEIPNVTEDTPSGYIIPLGCDFPDYTGGGNIAATCTAPAIPVNYAGSYEILVDRSGGNFQNSPIYVDDLMGGTFVYAYSPPTVTIGGTTCSNVTVNSSSSITCNTGAHAAGTVNVVVNAPGQGSGTLTNGFTYVNPATTPATPSLSATPGNGQVSLSWTTPNNGGATITGYSVQYKTNANGSWSTWSFSGTGTSTTITGLTNGTLYNFRVAAINSVGTGSYGTNNATPVAPAPTISSVVTATGAGVTSNYTVKSDGSWPNATIGTNITTRTVAITGTNFTGATAVTVGGTACSPYTVNSATSITCTLANTAKNGDQVVVVTTSGGATTSTGTAGTNVVRYVSAPSVSSVSVATAKTNGQAPDTLSGTSWTTVTNTTNVITGTNFNTATTATVSIGGTCTSYTITNSTQISCNMPNWGSAGLKTAQVTNAYGASGTTISVTAVAAPTITSISPNSGLAAAGGTSITLTGTNYNSTFTTTVGGTNCTAKSYTNSTTSTCTTPAKSAGTQAVVTRTPYGTSNSVNVTYVAPTIRETSYQFYNNANSTTPGAARAGNNTAASVGQPSAAGQDFRLRTGIFRIDGALSSGSFILQFTQKTAATCSAQSTGWASVTTSSAIAYKTNSSATSGASITASPAPSVSGTWTPQKYVSNPSDFSVGTSIPANGYGLWDFSLTNLSATANTPYCFRIVNSDSTTLDAYDQYPEILTGADPYITLSNSGNVNVGAMAPNTMKSASGTVSVSTNYIQGYKLNLSTNQPNTNPNANKLIHSSGNFTISTLSGASLAGGTSAWGYRANYTGSSFGATTTAENTNGTSSYSWDAIPDSSSPTQIRANSNPTDTTSAGGSNTPDVTSMWFGVGATANQASGTYQATVIYTAIAAP